LQSKYVLRDQSTIQGESERRRQTLGGDSWDQNKKKKFFGIFSNSASYKRYRAANLES